MGFNERNFQRAQANFTQLAQQLNEFTEWALGELKTRDLELKETHIRLDMARKQIDLLVGDLADAKREIEGLKEQLAEAGQVIAMPTAEVFTPEPEPEDTYDELMQRASMIQAQMQLAPESEFEAKSQTAVMEDNHEVVQALSEGPSENGRHFTMDLEHSGLAEEVATAADHTFAAAKTGVSLSKTQVFSMDLDMDSDDLSVEATLLEEPDPNFFAPAIAAINQGDRDGAVRFLREREAEWQTGEREMVRNYFDLMDQVILVAEGNETVVRSALIQMVHYATRNNQIDAARTFMKLNSGLLESIIQTEAINAQIFMDLGMLYFKLKMKYEFKRWMRVNRDQNRLQTFIFQEQDLWNLLYMALYFDQDHVVKEGIMAMNAKIMRPIPEAKLYREYVHAIREGREIDEALQQFDDRTTFMRYVDEAIRITVFPVMKDRLRAKADELRNQPEKVVDQASAEVEKKPDVAIVSEMASEKELAKVSQVYLVGGDGRQCPLDDTAMAYEEVDLLTYGSTVDRDRSQGGQYQKVRLLHCPTCQRYYINQFIRWGIAGFIRIAELNDREEHHIG